MRHGADELSPSSQVILIFLVDAVMSKFRVKLTSFLPLIAQSLLLFNPFLKHQGPLIQSCKKTVVRRAVRSNIVIVIRQLRHPRIGTSTGVKN